MVRINRRQPINFSNESEEAATLAPGAGEPKPQPGPQPEAPATQQPEDSPLPPAGPPASAELIPPVEGAGTTREADRSPFGDMLVKEYHAALDKQIAMATNKIMERFTRLLSQERTPEDVVKDALGNSSDYYENLVTAVQTGDPRIGKTKEEVYQYIAQLDFTAMRKIEAIKQEYHQT